MTNSLIHPSKDLGYTDIYLDFLAGKETSAHFYLAKDLRAVAGQLDTVEYPRTQLAAILRNQNTMYEASEKTFEAIDRLTDPQAVCVFSGQQAGFMGGPMYTILKALAVVKAARLYEEQLGRPVIPMFWIAGDDHDFEEVNHVQLLNRASEMVTISYESAPEQALSTSAIHMSDEDELARAKEIMREALGETDFTPELYDLIDRAYTSSDTLCSAFGKFMAALTAKYGLVLFCPGDPEAKALAAPFFSRLIECQEDLQDSFSSRNQEILDSGYHLQVEKKDESAHLFYDLNGRTAIHRDGDDFVVGETRFTREELLARINEHPERFSPDVITRPILQSYLFPTISQKGGPAEIAYLAQINPVFELFSMPAPVHVARATATIIESRFEKLMSEFGITFTELAGDVEQVINRVLLKSFPTDLEQRFERLRFDVERRFQDFINESLQFDPNLDPVAKQLYGKIDYTLKQFEGKVFSSHKKKSQGTRDKIYRLANTVYPNHGFQERTINVAYFISRYGMGIIDAIYDNLDSEETSHQLLYLSDMKV